ncbi:HLF transcription factor, PAR bZIP family member b isoform X1 [Acanthochromis polyacanthus]|uniref:HLF transcription factor, PAR bZIP family member b isoform X1 n=1 Tax=Acanthochromis polyacanthus TaxID=80966 RepID=UPI000B90919C|nr:HLF transcription factor, PAR bZIP family member b isoform X1 [Acanthochromis polyacanthus]
MLDPDRSDRSLLLRLKEEMSHRIPAPLHSGFLPPAPHGVLKSLLENPVKLPQHDAFSKDQDKEKKLEEERSAPQSAFLGPTLWDKTLPYDGDTFQLEYMDLEEFLSENGIPSSPSQQHHDQHRHNQRQPPIMVPPTPAPPTVVDLRNHASTSAHTTVVPSNARAGLLSSRNTPSPIDPDSIQVPVGYDPDPADLALSSVPGQEMFDPRRRKFSADELKPQPMIKKARKVFIPEDMKQDDKYWARRRKNNLAAKRSRDARRLKENQIAIRAGFLEKENSALRQEVADLRKELGRTKTVLAEYEARHGPL